MPRAYDWQKSSFSGGDDGDNCIEIAVRTDIGALLRESDAPEHLLTMNDVTLATLIRTLKSRTVPQGEGKPHSPVEATEPST
ncbi:DUF397 domain-containing protein [Streptomyces sp. JJ36]|uniref:DUF397 domain-containing protein n=1 Tax=Streptomyces sp. JJ36 TaxID=2736645 RepID=UPI001F47D1DD|nr:DUF397 domain-containing protein [Streptomyces sp. JJ36]MCF6525065.1 DUF397 domain-containing protein [Streptomyces sp. JJ36]